MKNRTKTSSPSELVFSGPGRTVMNHQQKPHGSRLYFQQLHIPPAEGAEIVQCKTELFLQSPQIVPPGMKQHPDFQQSVPAGDILDFCMLPADQSALFQTESGYGFFGTAADAYEFQQEN